MSVAQRLYENGFITYMRTDSTTLSGGAVGAARDQVRELYGAEYLPDSPRTYASKVKNAQEAHEAIRPAGESFRTPAQTGLSGEQFRLYELIWMRTVASQMKDAVGNSVTIRIGGAAADGRDAVFSSSGRTITFHGFLKAYVEDIDDASKRKDDAETRLPNLTEGAAVIGRDADPRGPRDQAARALHRGDPDQGARGPRDRPPVDVRLDHRHDPQPRLRLQEGHRAGPGVAGVLGDPAARGALPAAGVLRVHRLDGGRARRDRRRPQGPRHRARRVLLRRRRRRRAQDARHRPRRDRRQGDGDLPDRPRGHRPPRRPLRAVRRGAAARGRRRCARCGPTSPTTSRPTS